MVESQILLNKEASHLPMLVRLCALNWLHKVKIKNLKSAIVVQENYVFEDFVEPQSPLNKSTTSLNRTPSLPSISNKRKSLKTSATNDYADELLEYLKEADNAILVLKNEVGYLTSRNSYLNEVEEEVMSKRGEIETLEDQLIASKKEVERLRHLLRRKDMQFTELESVLENCLNKPATHSSSSTHVSTDSTQTIESPYVSNWVQTDLNMNGGDHLVLDAESNRVQELEKKLETLSHQYTDLEARLKEDEALIQEFQISCFQPYMPEKGPMELNKRKSLAVEILEADLDTSLNSSPPKSAKSQKQQYTCTNDLAESEKDLSPNSSIMKLMKESNKIRSFIENEKNKVNDLGKVTKPRDSKVSTKKKTPRQYVGDSDQKMVPPMILNSFMNSRLSLAPSVAPFCSFAGDLSSRQRDLSLLTSRSKFSAVDRGFRDSFLCSKIDFGQIKPIAPLIVQGLKDKKQWRNVKF